MRTETPYMVMCTQANHVNGWYNFFAALFAWLTLAGYVVFPNTFTSLKASTTLGESQGGKIVQKAVQNIPLVPVAAFCYIVGTVGTFWLWRKWRTNYVWLSQHLFS